SLYLRALSDDPAAALARRREDAVYGELFRSSDRAVAAASRDARAHPARMAQARSLQGGRIYCRLAVVVVIARRRSRRSNPEAASKNWIASRSLSSGRPSAGPVSSQ